MENKKEIDKIVNECSELFTDIDNLYMICSLLDNLIESIRYNIETQEERKQFNKIQESWLNLITIFNHLDKEQK